MFKRIFVGLIVVAAVGLGAFAVYAWHPPIAPVAPPAASAFPPDLVARGAMLAGAGNCATCHTAKGGQPNAGGYPIESGFGTIYSTNITPDPETGIGAWSEQAFRRAMYEGVARDGSHLFPAFPYDHFTKLTGDDVSALYAYFMTRTPVHSVERENTLPFPLNVRFLQAGWKLLFFRPGRFEPQLERGPEWNRGAYLAEGITHCGACHTPRNLAGAEKRGQAFTGAAIEHWLAPPLTQGNPSPVPWSKEELFVYLRSGVSQFHGTAAGPMSPVVHDGLAKLPDADIHALALYFANVDHAAARTEETETAIQRALEASPQGVKQQFDPAAAVYTAACASCHYNGGDSLNPLRPELALNSAVHLSDPTNLIQIILHGVGVREGAPEIVMPAFARGLTDADIARIAGYLRATRTTRDPWPDLEKGVTEVRAQGNQPMSGAAQP